MTLKNLKQIGSINFDTSLMQIAMLFLSFFIFNI